MNEQTPDQQPEPRPADGVAANDPAFNDPAPRNPAAPTGADASATAVLETEPAPKRGRGILKPILVGTGAAFVVLAVAGVGMSIADAVDGGDDDPAPSQPVATAPAPTGAPGGTPGASPSPSDGADDHGGDRGDHGDDGHGGDDDGVSHGASAVSSEPTDLVAALEAAVQAAGGGTATSIEVEHHGYKIDVRLDDGTEVDVRVPPMGEPIVRADDDDDDTSSDAPLDPARVADISAAAIAAAGGGTVLSIEAEDDEVRFEVEVAQDGDDVDVDLADDLSVVAVDR